MRALRPPVMALCGLLLAGCGGGLKCADDAPYRSAREDPPMVVPTGLDSPASDTALVIPPVGETPPPRPPGVPVCMEQPPSYHPDRPRPEV